MLTIFNDHCNTCLTCLPAVWRNDMKRMFYQLSNCYVSKPHVLYLELMEWHCGKMFIFSLSSSLKSSYWTEIRYVRLCIILRFTAHLLKRPLSWIHLSWGIAQFGCNIRLVSHAFSYHCRLDCLLNILPRLSAMKRRRPHFWPLVRVNHRRPVDSPHKGPVMEKAFICHDYIMDLMMKQASAIC